MTILSKNTSQDHKPAPDGGRLSGDWSTVKALLQERKEKGLADRVETQTRIINGDLVLRDTVTLAIGNIFSVYRGQFLELDLSLGDTICAVLGVPEKESHNVRKIMNDMAYDAVREQLEGITVFLQN